MKKQQTTRGKAIKFVLLFLIILGIIGGVLIKIVFYDGVGNGTMLNSEANRLISYLGIREYTYTDKMASSFNVGDAKRLLKAADISYDQVEVQLQYLPGFIPLTKTQFEDLYASLIQLLEVDRLSKESLYIYNIDSANDKEINGVLYEVVSTNAGDYYMEKDYGMDHAYISKVVDLYVSNNEIILCEGESKESITIYNAYASKITADEEGNNVLLAYVNSRVYQFQISKEFEEKEAVDGILCDITLSNAGVTGVTNHMGELVETKVTAYEDGIVSLDGYEEKFTLSSAFNVYKINGSFKATQSAGTLIGYDKVSLYVKENSLEAALITEDIYAKNIRVLINNTDYTNYYHDEVAITSDTEFTVTYGGNTKEYAAGDVIRFRNGSEELAKGTAKIQSKVEDGKIEISSIQRQSGHPAYRGILELARDDKGVLVVNELSVEEYLYGVVPSEMPASYEKEALKAQAICARAYAYRQMESENYAKYGAHLDDSVSSQVYNNVLEDERTNFAVDDTYGVVPCYDGEVIEAFFFSTSCGATSNNSSVWGGYQKPYLLDSMETELNDLANLQNEENFRAFIDGELGTGFIEEDEPFFRWTVNFKKEELTEAINANLYNRINAMPEYILALDANGEYVKKDIASIGDLEKITVTKRGDSGIIEEMIIKGTQETIWVKGQSNARALLSPVNVTIRKQDGSTVSGWQSLPSAYFYVDDSDGYVIRGGGFGHGVGMSQNGANNMAKLGYTAGDIITHFYTAVELKDMYQLMGK